MVIFIVSSSIQLCSVNICGHTLIDSWMSKSRHNIYIAVCCGGLDIFPPNLILWIWRTFSGKKQWLTVLGDTWHFGDHGQAPWRARCPHEETFFHKIYAQNSLKKNPHNVKPEEIQSDGTKKKRNYLFRKVLKFNHFNAIFVSSTWICCNDEFWWIERVKKCCVQFTETLNFP